MICKIMQPFFDISTAKKYSNGNKTGNANGMFPYVVYEYDAPSPEVARIIHMAQMRQVGAFVGEYSA